jgi:hypothetical protein
VLGGGWRLGRNRQLSLCTSTAHRILMRLVRSSAGWMPAAPDDVQAVVT